jgi:protoporphyrinogen oxidase
MTRDVVILGAGFTGLAAARDLVRAGHRVTVLEADAHLGGLGGSFTPSGGGEALDRFYHHWFTSDTDIMGLVTELGLSDSLTMERSLTGVYVNGATFRLSGPLDLLRFGALPFADRLRLGWLSLEARRVRDWRALEGLTAAEWLIQMGGQSLYQRLWEPLLRGKFGQHAPQIGAVWMWNKLKLRGGSRKRGGAEHLGYLRGSFARLADALGDDIRANGGTILTGTRATRIDPRAGRGWQVQAGGTSFNADHVIATPAPALLADLVAHWADPQALTGLRAIPYLANLCLVLELDRPLGSTYWLNVTDPEFPFVGIIEHTHFQPSAQYGGRHIVYLSRYLPQDDPLLAQGPDGVLDFALPHLRRMFPAFDRAWLLRHHVWRADWAQPVITRQYSALIPPEEALGPGLHLCSMAQIYPEDRGTNYAVRAGRALARRIITAAD